MFDLAPWQWAVTGIVAAACVGTMAVTIVRMLWRPVQGTATLRPSTPVETGLVGAVPAANERVFDGFSYRATARYAGRVRVVVTGTTVTVAGPRAPRGLYVLWIWLQGITLALVPPALVLGLVAFDFRALPLALGIFIVSSLFMVIGAGVWPGMGETLFVGEGRFDATEVPLADVRGVTIGENWARDGLRLVIAPYAPGIDALAAGRAVCWNAPDGEGHDASWAIHMLSEADATELHTLLSGRPGQ